MDEIINILFEHQDLKYKIFNSKLIPNIDSNKIIGVRVPIIRKIANDIKDNEYVDDFLNNLPHKYHEENMLHGIILSIKYKDIDIFLEKLDKFLDYVDNWALTDTINPKIFKKYSDKVYDMIKVWLKSNRVYKVRFGVVSLLQYYLDDNYDKKILALAKNIRIRDYYIDMAIAWFYSVALVKQYDDAIIYLENRELDKVIHNMTIQKGLDSYRISDSRKEYLKSLRIK